MTISFDRAYECDRTPVRVVEGYSPANGLAHGSLDVTVGVCDEHHQQIRTQLIDCGLTPYTLQHITDQPCGDRTTFAPNRYTETHKEEQ